jgi:uncharacterized protein
MSRPVALVTGATSGLGLEFAAQLAASGHDLVLVARNGGRLAERARELGPRFGVEVETIAADLTEPASLARVEARVSAEVRPVSVLINNAGTGMLHPFERNTAEEEEQLLHVHVRAPMRLTHAALTQMLPRREGTIVNVASIAAFVPRGTYSAAKAWIVTFSRWANWHYRRRGVTVTAVAPGFVHTEFHSRMGAQKERVPGVLWLDPPRVVRSALAAAGRRKAVAVPSLRYKLILAVTKVLPTRLLMAGSLEARPTD